MQYVRIPAERVAVLIGEKGSTRRRIEKASETKIKVDDSSVSIEGESHAEWITKDVVKAIARGFNPDKALHLLKEDHVFELIDLKDVCGTDKSIKRFKGRIIGEKGRTRKNIEEYTGSFISVYGNTVGVIGSFDGASAAKEAVRMILGGAPHSTVYRFLERWRRTSVQPVF